MAPRCSTPSNPNTGALASAFSLNASGAETSGTIYASGVTVNLTGAGNFTVIGADDTVVAMPGSTINVDGTGIEVNLSNGVIDAANSLGFGVGGNGNTINLGTGDSLGANGGDNTVDAQTGDQVGLINTNGAYDAVNGSGVQVNLASNVQANVGGNSNTIGLNPGDSMGVWGGGNTFNGGQAGDGLVLLNTNGAYDVVNANGDAASGTTANGQGTGVTLSPGAQANVVGGNDGVGLNPGATVGLFGAGYSVGGTDATVNAGANTSLILSGGTDTIGLFSPYDNLTLTGGQNYNIVGSDDAINTLGGTSFNLSGNGDSVGAGGTGDYVDLDGNSNNVIFGGGDSVLALAGGAGNAVAMNDGVLSAATDTNFDLDGSGDGFILQPYVNFGATGGGNVFSVSSLDYAALDDEGYGPDGASANSDVLVYTPDSSGTLDGSDNTIYGSTGNNLTIDGINDPAYANGGTVNYSGANTGDYLYGVDDTGSNDAGYSANSDVDELYTTNYNIALYDDDGLSGQVASYANVVGQADLSEGDTEAADAATAALGRAEQAIEAASDPAVAPPQPFNGIMWTGPVITWDLSGTVQPQYQAVVEQAISAWAQAAGLKFEQVSGTTPADLRIGWADFESQTSGLVGLTSATIGLSGPQSVSIQLENPAQDALTPSANGGFIYSGTGVGLYQDALHEIGHALGLGESSDPSSIMFPVLGASNATLSPLDTAEIDALYDPSALAGNGAALLLAQARAAFGITAPETATPSLTSGMPR